MKYLIKEIAKLLGISPTTIRYYDKIGIIKIEKDKNTGYRKFDPIDVNILMRARMLRAQGFSMEEIGTILNESSVDERSRIYDNRRQEICKEISELQYLQEKMSERINMLEHLKSEDSNVFEEVVRPTMYGIIYRDMESISKDKELRDEISRWMEHASYIYPMTIINTSAIAMNQPGFHMGLCITEEDAEHVGLQSGPLVVKIPTCRCVRMTQKICVVPDRTKGIMKDALDKLKEKGIQTESLIYGRSLYSYREDNQLYVMNEHWFPIK